MITAHYMGEQHARQRQALIEEERWRDAVNPTAEGCALHFTFPSPTCFSPPGAAASASLAIN